MIDWHSHILPGIDDGSDSVAESLALLDMLARQGIKAVAATPHFDADEESVDAFVQRRARALDSLKNRGDAAVPRILCGAEVQYYPGISRMADLRKLCIGDSRLLLLEMPGSRWTEYTLRELTELAASGRVTVVLAHIERYLGLQTREIWNRLLDSGILMQSNASFFNNIQTRRKALSWLKAGRIHLIGSDCHNLTSRPPRMGEACAVIEKRLGKRMLRQLAEIADAVFV